MANAKHTHELYHEAKRRASQPQAPIKHTKANSLLLSAPNSIIFELFNTMIREINTEKLLSFIKSHLRVYLDSNWTNKTTVRMVARLRRDQAIDVRAGIKDVPSIRLSSPSSPSSPSVFSNIKTRESSKSAGRALKSMTSKATVWILPSSSQSSATKQRSPPVDYNEQTTKRQTAIDQIYQHVMWRINSENVSQATSLLVKLVIDDGYKTGKLKADLYDDVASCFEDWRGQKLIKLYAFGSAPANDQRLILSSTSHGDLSKWIANYIDGSEKRTKPDLLRKLAMALRDKTKNCIFITNELIDALQALETGSLRCVFLIDRLNQYEPIESMANFKSHLEPLLISGKLYVMNSMKCVEFAPDPTTDSCC